MLKQIIVTLSLAAAIPAIADLGGSVVERGETKPEACSNARNSAQRKADLNVTMERARYKGFRINILPCNCSEGKDMGLAVDLTKWTCEVSWELHIGKE